MKLNDVFNTTISTYKHFCLYVILLKGDMKVNEWLCIMVNSSPSNLILKF